MRVEIWEFGYTSLDSTLAALSLDKVVVDHFVHKLNPIAHRLTTLAVVNAGMSRRL